MVDERRSPARCDSGNRCAAPPSRTRGRTRVECAFATGERGGVRCGDPRRPPHRSAAPRAVPDRARRRTRYRGGDSGITIDSDGPRAPAAARRIDLGTPRGPDRARPRRPCRTGRGPARSNAGRPGGECVRGCPRPLGPAPTGCRYATSGRCAANCGTHPASGRNIDRRNEPSHFCDLHHSTRNAWLVTSLLPVDESRGLRPGVSL